MKNKRYFSYNCKLRLKLWAILKHRIEINFFLFQTYWHVVSTIFFTALLLSLKFFKTPLTTLLKKINEKSIFRNTDYVVLKQCV